MGLQGVTSTIVAPLASLQHSAFGILAQCRTTARVNQRLVREQAAKPGGVQLGPNVMRQPVSQIALQGVDKTPAG